MLAPIPPGRTMRSSTRNDSDTLCSWSGSSCSANRPGKCIRWSVAIEPVTAIFIGASGGRGYVEGARPVDDDLDRGLAGRELADDVAVERPLVEEELVAQAGTAPGLDGDPHPQVVTALLVEQPPHLLSRHVRQYDGLLGLLTLRSA